MELFESQYEALVDKNFKIRFRGQSYLGPELSIPIFTWYFMIMFKTQSGKIVFKDHFYPVMDVESEENKLSSVIPFTPDCQAVRRMLEVGNSRNIVPVSFLGFASIETAKKYKNQTKNKGPIVIFDNDDACAAPRIPKYLKLKLSIDHTMEDETKSGFAFDYTSAGVSRAQLYVAQMFVSYWQQSENISNVTRLRLSTARLPESQSQQMNARRIEWMDFFDFFDIFVFLALTGCEALVHEKEMKLKESMALMGMTMYAYWLAWFSLSLMWICLIIAGTAVVLFTSLFGQGLLFVANPLLLVILMAVVAVDIHFFSLLLSCFVKRVNDATAILIINFLLVWLSNILYRRIDGTVLIYLAGTSMFGFGYTTAVTKIKHNERVDVVSTFSNINDKDLRGGSILDGIICMSLNAFLSLVLTWYVDEVYKGDYGIARPFYFCFTKSYWIASEALAKDIPDIPSQNSKYFEIPSRRLIPGIQVRDMVKTFGDKTAVDGVNIDIYSDQITVLLGHNGAGKTTFISMITGFIPPTSGTAVVNGYDINENLSKVRESIGFCPQHDILFNKLTVFEHLVFYCKLRGQYRSKVDSFLLDVLDQIGLAEKKESFPDQLSGGQRRKLSVACAFSADNKIIFLDEPSSGLDPSARQDLWRFLKLKRRGRTILMTTHYMDEADAIGDRIAIMAKGAVQCCGTSWFLKNVYGTGYKLTIVKGKTCDANNITARLSEMLPSAYILDETRAEIEYRIPDAEVNNLPMLLRDLETNKTMLNISSYGLNATTMEDVFVKVGEESGTGVEKDIRKNIVSPTKSISQEVGSVDSIIYTTGVKTVAWPEDKEGEHGYGVEFDEMVNFTKNRFAVLFLQQLCAVVDKRTILFKRTYVTSAMLLLIPGLFMLLGTFVDKHITSENTSSQFSLDGFQETLTLVSKDKEASDDLLQAYASQFRPPHHVHILPNSTNTTAGVSIMEYAKSRRAYDYGSKVYIGAQFSANGSIGYYRSTSLHTQGITVQMLINAHIKHELGHGYAIQTGLSYKVVKDSRQIPYSTSTNVFLTLVFAILPSVFIHRLIEERATGSKHLQTLSGVNPFAYWLGVFLFDAFIVAFIEMTIFLAFLNHPFVYLAEGRWIVLLAIFIMYAGAMLPFMYCVQLLFDDPDNGVTTVVFLNFIFGFLLAPFLSIMAKSSKTLGYIHASLAVVFPNYALDLNVKQLTSMASIGPKRDGYFGPDPNDDFRIDYYLLYHLVQQISYWLILMCIECDVLTLLWYLKCWPLSCVNSIFEDNKMAETPEDEESDVVQERERITKTPLSDLFKTDSILMLNLKKKYLLNDSGCATFTAVKSTCLGIAPSECFGLLGQNGAGKTTIFKMLTGDVVITDGDIYVESKNIKWYLTSIQSRMGYCPQHDALHDLLTGQELLFFYGRLRGVPAKDLPVVAARVVAFVHLHPYETELTREYSGGTKRKLSMGISIIGNPAFFMLDEPTAGMDPISKRAVWGVLNLIRRSGRTLLLTSHSMEECDALCTRVAIMVQGRLKCLGSPQYLKNKYGQGYTVVIHATVDDQGQVVALDEATEFIINAFSDCKIFNKMDSFVHMQVPETGRSVADIFDTLQEAQDRFKFARYTVQQTSLEQVFLMFMKKTEDV